VRQVAPDRGRQGVDVGIDRLREGVEPVHPAQVEVEFGVELDAGDAERHDGDVGAGGDVDLVEDGLGLVHVVREHQHHHMRGLDGLGDLFAIGHAGDLVARRDPASDALGLEPVTDRVRRQLVERAVTDEDVVAHRLSSRPHTGAALAYSGGAWQATCQTWEGRQTKQAISATPRATG
jgi:hypothetical protein